MHVLENVSFVGKQFLISSSYTVNVYCCVRTSINFNLSRKLVVNGLSSHLSSLSIYSFFFFFFNSHKVLKAIEKSRIVERLEAVWIINFHNS